MILSVDLESTQVTDNSAQKTQKAELQYGGKVNGLLLRQRHTFILPPFEALRAVRQSWTE